MLLQLRQSKKVPTESDLTLINTLRSIPCDEIAVLKLNLLLSHYYENKHQLSKAIGCTNPTLYRWLNGEHEVGYNYARQIDTLYNAHFKQMDPGQVSAHRRKGAWIVSRRHWEQHIGLPARPRGGSTVDKYREKRDYPNEHDSRLHPICCAVNRAIRLEYAVPARVMADYNKIMNGDPHGVSTNPRPPATS